MLLGVSELMADVDVGNDPLFVIRRQTTTNKYGESVTMTTKISLVGAVYPTGPNSLVREEAYQTQAKTITVVTEFRLRPASQVSNTQFQPDLVMWGGDCYIVKSFKDYSKYGAGMIEAECALFNYVDTAPLTIPYEAVMNFQDPSNAALVPGVLRCF